MLGGSFMAGASRAAFCVLYPYGLHGCFFYIFSQVSHIQHGCFDLKSDEVDLEIWHHSHPNDKVSAQFDATRMSASLAAAQLRTDRVMNVVRSHVPKEWAVHEVESAFDYAVDSTFWLHFSLGLNLQAVHHLFPQIGWGHYTALYPIFREVCEQFGVRYQTVPTLRDAIVLHYDYLVSINDEPCASVWVPAPPTNISVGAMDLLDQLDPTLPKKPIEQHKPSPTVVGTIPAANATVSSDPRFRRAE